MVKNSFLGKSQILFPVIFFYKKCKTYRTIDLNNYYNFILNEIVQATAKRLTFIVKRIK